MRLCQVQWCADTTMDPTLFTLSSPERLLSSLDHQGNGGGHDFAVEFGPPGHSGMWRLG